MSAKLDLTRAGNTLSFPWPKASHWSDAESMFAAEAEAAGRDWSSAWSNVLADLPIAGCPPFPRMFQMAWLEFAGRRLPRDFRLSTHNPCET